MKKLFLALSVILISAGTWAVPAKRGLWQTLTLSDGTTVRAQLTGDEHMHFYETESGERYVINDGIAIAAPMEEMRANARVRRQAINNRQRMPRRVSMGEQTHYKGQKKGIVILMNFKDTKFKTGNDLAKYQNILNKENYNEGSFKGSVADYFKAQSGGQFELSFDVVGPYTANNNYSYYGKNTSSGDDMYPEKLIVEAVKAANAEVNFKDYDWDNDGQVDQVFVLYAGKGEADGGNSNTIWPHMYNLSETGSSLTLDGVVIDTYACSSELTGSGTICGIGTFCHEFSHCLGYPDFYDTSYGGWFGMGSWDLMDMGSYNGNGFQPCGYSAYEKWMAGWIEPIELNKESVTVENLKTTLDGGDAYIIYNDGNRNEYYMVENRQKKSWDAGLPGRGLMIVHVDFDKDIWEQNTPNTEISAMTALQNNIKANNHQRFTIFHADNTASTYNESSDLYPYSNNNSLTNSSTPAASLYNSNTDGKKYMNKPITGIKQNTDGTMSFKFNDGVSPKPDDPIVEKGDTLFYESFDKCSGKGGNDGAWSGAVGSSAFDPDNNGWTALSDKMFGANKCAKFGTGSVIGKATTPTFTIDGEATLTFKAGAWNGTNDGTSLIVTPTNSSITLTGGELTMKKGEWSVFTIILSGQGSTELTFTPSKRWFLDDVLVMKKSQTTGINAPSANTVPMRIYTIDGRFVGTSLDMLRPGIYVIGGKKVVR